jgi:hypothetical protein
MRRKGSMFAAQVQLWRYNRLQHRATYCNAAQRRAARCSTVQRQVSPASTSFKESLNTLRTVVRAKEATAALCPGTARPACPFVQHAAAHPQRSAPPLRQQWLPACLPARRRGGMRVSSRVGDARDCEPRSPRRRLVPVDVRPRRRRRLAVAVHTGHVLIRWGRPGSATRARAVIPACTFRSGMSRPCWSAATWRNDRRSPRGRTYARASGEGGGFEARLSWHPNQAPADRRSPDTYSQARFGRLLF